MAGADRRHRSALQLPVNTLSTCGKTDEQKSRLLIDDSVTLISQYLSAYYKYTQA